MKYEVWVWDSFDEEDYVMASFDTIEEARDYVKENYGDSADNAEIRYGEDVIGYCD